jgi:hypothetical protein
LISVEYNIQRKQLNIKNQEIITECSENLLNLGRNAKNLFDSFINDYRKNDNAFSMSIDLKV